MKGRPVGIVVAAVLSCLILAAVATSGGVGMWREPQWDPPTLDADPVEIDGGIDVDDELADPDSPGRSSYVLPRWIRVVLSGLVTAAMIIAVVALVIALWNRRPRLRWRRRQTGEGDFDVLPDVAAAVVDEAVAQRAELLDGAPRNAIVRCWHRLERDVEAAGLPRPPADTSAEFTERVLTQYSVDPEAIHALSTLYREARFSDHPLDENARRAALDALDRLHRALADDPATADSANTRSSSAGATAAARSSDR